MNQAILDDFAYMRDGKQVKALTEAERDVLDAIDISSDNNDHVMLLIHGFTSSPAVYRELIEPIKAKGYAILCPVLPGHSTSIEDFASTSSEQWLDCVEQTYQQAASRYKKVSLLGLSLGGVLAYRLAQKYPIKNMYLLAPALGLKLPMNLADYLLRFARLFGLKQLKAIGGNIHRGDLSELTYKSIPISALLELFHCIRTTPREKVSCPTHVFLGRYDKAVSNKKVKEILTSIHCDELQDAAHVLPLDDERNTILAAIVNA